MWSFDCGYSKRKFIIFYLKCLRQAKFSGYQYFIGQDFITKETIDILSICSCQVSPCKIDIDTIGLDKFIDPWEILMKFKTSNFS